MTYRLKYISSFQQVLRAVTSMNLQPLQAALYGRALDENQLHVKSKGKPAIELKQPHAFIYFGLVIAAHFVSLVKNC